MLRKLAVLKARVKALTETSDVVKCPSCRRLMRVKRHNVKVLCPHCSSILHVASKDRVQVVSRGVYKPPRLTSQLLLPSLLILILSAALAVLSGDVSLGSLLALLANMTLWALASYNLVLEAEARER